MSRVASSVGAALGSLPDKVGVSSEQKLELPSEWSVTVELCLWNPLVTRPWTAGLRHS
jgi:hypothetical protein